MKQSAALVDLDQLEQNNKQTARQYRAVCLLFSVYLIVKLFNGGTVSVNCMICGNNIKMLTGKKLERGQVCSTCLSQIPSLILDIAPYLPEYSLKSIMDTTAKNLEKFSVTASYGDLHIDEINGVFAIAKALDDKGKPKGNANVFSIYDLTEVGLYCKSPRADHNIIVADVEFKFKLSNIMSEIKVIIKRSAKCNHKRINPQEVSWEEPHEMEMFKTLFNQMLSGAWQKVNQYLCGKTVREFEIEKARAIFMLPDDYTDADLKKARRLMMKVYHPDKGEDVTREAQIINEAFDLLKAELERRGV